MEEPKRFERHLKFLLILCLISGAILILALPLGLIRIDQVLFRLVFLLHFAAQSFCLLLSVSLFLQLLHGATFGRLLFGSLFWAFVGVLVAQALLPITEKDALIYHLQTPKLWLQSGKISEVSWLEWSYFPMQLGLAYTGLLHFGLERLTPLYHASYLLLACAVIAGFIYQRTKDTELSIIAYLLCLSLPVSFKFGPAPMADFAVALYFSVALYYLIEFSEAKQTRQTLLAGVALGLALSAKYNAFLGGLVLCLLLPLLLQQHGFRIRELCFAVLTVGLTAIFLVSPWMIRNAFWTGNPFYPFLGHLFHGQEAVPFLGMQSPILYRIAGRDESILDIILIPIRIVLFGQDDNPKQFDGQLSPLLLLGVLPFIFRKKLSQSFLTFSGLFIVVYFFAAVNLFHLLLRYLSPLLFVGIVLTVMGILTLHLMAGEKRKKLIYLGCFALHLAVSLPYLIGLLQRSETFQFYFSRQTKEEYLRKRLNDYSMTEYINNHLAPASRVYLLLTGNQFYYFTVDVRGGYFSADPIIWWIQQATSPDELWTAFVREGITHLMLEGIKTNKVLAEKLTPDEVARWNAFLKRHTRLIHRDKSNFLREIQR